MLYTIAEIFLCCFAVLGFIDLIIYVSNFICLKKSSAVAELRLVSCPEENTEYAIRFYEGLDGHSLPSGTITRIVIGDGVSISDGLLSELCAKYGNIVKIETDKPTELDGI